MVAAMALSSGLPEAPWARGDSGAATRGAAASVSVKDGAPVVRVQARAERVQRQRPSLAAEADKVVARPRHVSVVAATRPEHARGHEVRVALLALPPPMAGV